MNKTKHIPFTQDKQLAKSVADCKKAFQKWELDKAKKEQVNPAKNKKRLSLLPNSSALSKLSRFDKIVLLTVAIYVVWVLTALYQMSTIDSTIYMDSPIEPTNTTNLT